MILKHINKCVTKYPTASFSIAASAATEPIKNQINFRTTETDPSNHKNLHLSKFYRQDAALKKQLFVYGGLPKSFELQTKTFTECCLMIRKPALEIMRYIRSTDISTKPTIRYVLYGKAGVGKSLTLAHLLHFGLNNGFVLVHVPWASNWYTRPKETANSTTQEGFKDLPIDAAAWLMHFKTQNTKLLSELNLTCSQEYVWSKRETTPANATLLELIEHGIARIKFASDVIAALLGELKRHATAGKCKIFVAIDGFNAMVQSNSRIFSENKVKMTPAQITLTKPFLDITNFDWCNGVCVLTVDQLASSIDLKESELPRYLLGKTGFEHLDPFVPIRVDSYDEQEFKSCIDYYLDRKWLQTNTDGFYEELKYLSACNPFRLMELCKSL